MSQHANLNSQTWLAPVLKASLLGTVLVLSGCAGFKVFSPSTWFSSPLMVSSSGLGQVTNFSPMQADTIKKQLNDRYSIRNGMQMENGEVVTVFQGIDDDKVKVEIIGPEHGYVSRIVVSDPNVVTEWGPKIGTPFSDIYEKAFGVCGLGERIDNVPTVECNSPQSSQVVYRFTGKWQGPEDLMPSDNDLKEWEISQILWHK
ncbi:RpoE-regulated lipoprotein [Providencia vermicola]|uniref:RpoE-regulated lipoprotein n=1 Tax=Providencia vermicola TaxID=333965 RepID=UPI001CECC012|nr:RpoE-regulated lipoprotein [Providencia vermicola]